MAGRLCTSVLLCTLSAAPLYAQTPTPITIRIATAAPDGTGWAREFRAWSRNVDVHTKGAVQIKWYFGGIAGDELQVGERITRGQVDGTASGGALCQALSETMRVTRAQGLFQRHEELTFLLGRMRKSIEDDFKRSGLAYLGGPVIGGEHVFSRVPLKGLDQVLSAKLWRWDSDKNAIALSRLAGMTIEPFPLPEAGSAFDAGKLDGFDAIPASVLAFQWTPRVRAMIDFPHAFLAGCLVVHERVWDRLSAEQREIVRGDAVQAIIRVDEVTRLADQALIGGLFQKQGIAISQPDAAMSSGLAARFKSARERYFTGASAEILKKFETLLGEYRASHK